MTPRYLEGFAVGQTFRSGRWRIRLTRQGRQLLKTAVPAWSAAQQQVKKVLGDGFVEQLHQALKRVSNGGAAR